MHFPFERGPTYTMADLRAFEQRLSQARKKDRALSNVWRIAKDEKMKRWIKISGRTRQKMQKSPALRVHCESLARDGIARYGVARAPCGRGFCCRLLLWPQACGAGVRGPGY